MFEKVIQITKIILGIIGLILVSQVIYYLQEIIYWLQIISLK